MNIQIRTSSGISLVPEETLLLSDRIVFVEGTIDSALAMSFMKHIMVLLSRDHDKPISVVINSAGGEINAGMMMYDLIRSANIKTYCAGRAYSMAAVLFACGKHGRYMFPHSELMLHEPLVGNGIGGSASSIRTLSENLMDIRRKLNLTLSEATGRTPEEIDEATAYDHFYSPEESIDFGLADGIADLSMLRTE